MTAQRILEDAYSFLSEGSCRWVQDEWAQREGQALGAVDSLQDADSTCLMGAICRAAHTEPEGLYEFWEEVDPALAEALTRVALEIDPRGGDRPTEWIAFFNDRIDTTYEDALLVLKRSIAK